MKIKILFLLATCVAFIQSFAQSCGNGGIYTLSNYESLLSGCSSLNGDLMINATYFDNLDVLENLNIVSGDVYIFAMDDVGNVDLSGLSNLDSIGGKLTISDLTGVADLSFLNSLQYVAGDLIIEGPMNLTGLENLHTVGGKLRLINEINGFAALDGLTSIGEIDMENISTTSVNIFAALESIEGDIAIYFADNFCSEFSGFHALEHAGDIIMGHELYGGLCISNFNAFSQLQTADLVRVMPLTCDSFSGFQNLVQCSTYVQHFTCAGESHIAPKLEDCNSLIIFGDGGVIYALDSVEIYTGKIRIGGAPGDVHFNTVVDIQEFLDISLGYPWEPNPEPMDNFFFPALQHIGGLGLYIHSTRITHLDFFESLLNVEGIVDIGSNVFLTDCSIDALCAKIEAEPENLDIESNGPGCETAVEVANGCGINNTTGMVYADLNCDGIFNANDIPIEHPVILNNEGLPSGVSDGNGNYFLPLENDATVSFGAQQPVGFLPISQYTITTNSEILNYPGYDFGLCPDPYYNNVSVFSLPGGIVQPGFVFWIDTWVSNLGGNEEQVNLIFDFADNPEVINVSSDDGTIAGTTIVWDITLSPLESRIITFWIYLDPATEVDAVLSFTTAVSIASEDILDVDATNNVYDLRIPVSSSYDPNDKTVNLPAVNMAEINPEEGTWLDYVIRFQNTGTASAVFIRVQDIIEEDLDISTIDMLESSHPCQLSFLEDRKVEWLFEDIMLPDSTTNEEESHGFIHFRIKTKNNLQLTDTISNSCAIYFDYNVPVITNTATTVFYTCDDEVQISVEEIFCEDETIPLSITGEWNDISWSNSDEEISNEMNLELQPQLPGSYSFEVAVSDEFCNYTDEVIISVLEIPSAPVITQDGNMLAASGIEGIYSWSLNGEVIQSSNENTIEITESGTYSVSIQSFDCVGEESSAYFEFVGIEEEEMKFTLQPNPASRSTVLISHLPNGGDVKIVDAFGKMIYSQKIISTQTNIDLSVFAPGIYHVCIESTTLKLIVH